MIKKSLIRLVVCLLLLVTNAWAKTQYVLDTGDPAERVCNPRSYTDLGNGIVRDNVTGLEWMQDGNLMASRNPSFDNDNVAGDGRVTWQHALDYIALLNSGEYLGHSDWRMPTIEELSTLADAGRYGPAINPIFSTVASSYWSSTTYAYNTYYAWYVFFYYGDANYSNKTNSANVRAVRGGSYGSLDNFVINGDGTVTDTTTALMWQQCNYGQTWNGAECIDSAATLTWNQAAAYVQELKDTHYLGYDDWRLPTRNELQSLLNYKTWNSATAFPNTTSSYWSSTAFPYYADSVWYVFFSEGIVNHYFKFSLYYVRAVRSGQCLSFNWCDDNDCEQGKYCDEPNDRCVDCLYNTDCDDAITCNGAETCADGVCVAGTTTCGGETPVCNENSNQCVECLVNGDCPAGSECINGACDNPPIFISEPLWRDAWVGLSTDPANPHKPQSQHVLFWAYDDDRLACTGGVGLSWMYRPVALQEGVVVALGDWVVKGEPWRFLWYAWIETPGIAEIAGPGLFEFKMTATDCLDQEIDSEGFWGKRYYFQVD